VFLEKIELRFIAEKAGLVNREIFEELRQLAAAFFADQ
jgi:hypothetical protein